MPIDQCRRKFEATLKWIMLAAAVLVPVALMQACRADHRAGAARVFVEVSQTAPCGTKIVRAGAITTLGGADRLLTGAELRKIGEGNGACAELPDGLECPCTAAEDCSNKTAACR